MAHEASPPAVPLTLILPAFNEAERLPACLADARGWLDAAFGGDYEVLAVDDGSRDATWALLEQAARGWPQLQPLRHAANRGKGAAIRTGVEHARGERILFADADGATPIRDERRLREALESGADLAVGSRLIPAPDVHRRRAAPRRWFGAAFAWIARALVPLAVRDTQCGFKMFRREAARHLFAEARETGYLLDVELLLLAERFGYRVVEVPVNWSEQPGSKLSLWRDGPRMLAGLWRVRRRAARLRVDLPVTHDVSEGGTAEVNLPPPARDTARTR